MESRQSVHTEERVRGGLWSDATCVPSPLQCIWPRGTLTDCLKSIRRDRVGYVFPLRSDSSKPNSMSHLPSERPIWWILFVLFRRTRTTTSALIANQKHNLVNKLMEDTATPAISDLSHILFLRGHMLIIWSSIYPWITTSPPILQQRETGNLVIFVRASSVN